MKEEFVSCPFRENEIYTTEMAAKILHRSPKTIREMCRRGNIPSRMNRGGYLITGWAIRAYVENRLVVGGNCASSNLVK